MLVAPATPSLGSERTSSSNIRLFLSAEQINHWLPASVPGTFRESFALQGTSHPAIGTSDTRFSLYRPHSEHKNEINVKINSTIATKLVPKTPLGTAQIDAAKNGVRYSWSTIFNPSGLTIHANVQPLRLTSGDSEAPSPITPLSLPALPAGCWIAFHQSAVNGLQPILDSQTIDAERFRKEWVTQWLPRLRAETTPFFPPAEQTPHYLKKNDTTSTKDQLVFAKQAIQTEFSDDQLLLTLRIAGYVKDQTQRNFDAPKVCTVIYHLSNQKGRFRLQLAGDERAALDEIPRKLLEEFLPQVMQFSSFQLEPWLQQRLDIELGQPTARNGWLVMPINPFPNSSPKAVK